jgi:hypothetical protein
MMRFEMTKLECRMTKEIRMTNDKLGAGPEEAFIGLLKAQ